MRNFSLLTEGSHKKSSSLNGLTPLGPSSLMAVGKKGSKTSYFFSLMAPPFTPPPLNGPAIMRRIFFCGFPKINFKIIFPVVYDEVLNVGKRFESFGREHRQSKWRN